MPQQLARPLTTPDAAGLRIVGDRRRVAPRGRRHIAKPLVRAVLIMVADERLNNMIQVRQAEAKEVVEAFPLELPNP